MLLSILGLVIFFVVGVVDVVVVCLVFGFGVLVVFVVVVYYCICEKEVFVGVFCWIDEVSVGWKCDVVVGFDGMEE